MLNPTREKSTLPGLAPSPEGTFDVRVVEPGDDVNLYEFDAAVERFRLSAVYHTRRPAPGDLAVLSSDSADGESDLEVLLISHRATSPGCVVNVRPIGVVETEDNPRCIITVPSEDDSMRKISGVDDLPEARRQQLVTWVQTRQATTSAARWRWGNATDAGRIVREARRASRTERARLRWGDAGTPAWRPLGSRVEGARRASDTEPYTDAERAYQELPFRFQRYVDEYLAPTERILFAVNRPAMTSALKRTWLSSEHLNEGILLITDQQVALLTEIRPLDRTSIKYGYEVRTGPPERAESVAVDEMNRRAFFKVTWGAAKGIEVAVWEFPGDAADELREAARVVQRWKPIPGSCSLRRAGGQKPIEIQLRDPAANDSYDVLRVAERLMDPLRREMYENEQALAGALLPAWADTRRVAHLLAVTDRRMIYLPDPLSIEHAEPLSYWLRQITTLEFTSSVLGSRLALNLATDDGLQRVQIPFPYTADDFQVCFTALRQRLSVVPD